VYNFKRVKCNEINTQQRDENAYQNTVMEIVSKKRRSRESGAEGRTISTLTPNK
jgi:hypothetical protein